jgi:hypothetical protein
MGPGLGIEAAPPVVDLRHLTRHAGHSIGASGFEWLSKRLSETLSADAYTAPHQETARLIRETGAAPDRSFARPRATRRSRPCSGAGYTCGLGADRGAAPPPVPRPRRAKDRA